MSAEHEAAESVAAIIVAAGPGSRLGAGRPKAFVEIGGVPLVVRSVRALLAVAAIEEAIVVGPPDGLADARALLNAHGPFRLPLQLVAGGAERQDSVRHGLAAVARAALVAIHDAARPFVSADAIEAAIAAARVDGAAIVAAQAIDTVKVVDGNGWIVSTTPRARTWLAQTPQVFRTDLIRAAHRQAADDGPVTDDAALLERLGHRVRVVAGNAENRKITTPADRAWAEWYLTQSATLR